MTFDTSFNCKISIDIQLQIYLLDDRMIMSYKKAIPVHKMQKEIWIRETAVAMVVICLCDVTH